MSLLKIISTSALFVAAFTSNSQEILSSNTFGGTSYDLVACTRIDSDNNQVLTGSFAETAELGMDGPSTTLTSAGSWAGFVAKYDEGLNLEWTFALTGSEQVQIYDCTLDSDDNIFVVGTYSSTVDFNPLAAEENRTATGGSSDIFIAKYNTTGTLLWVKSYGNGTHNDYAEKITTDPDGNCYVVGEFYGNVDMDPAGPDGLISSSMSDEAAGFLLKLDGAGNYMDAHTYWYTAPFDVELDTDGNVYVAGISHGTTDFNLAFGETEYVSPLSSQYGFVVKNTSDFDFEWVYLVDDASGSDHAVYEVAIDTEGDLYVSGYFQGTVDFDPSAGTSELTGTDPWRDPFTLKLTADKSLEWLHSTVILDDTYIDTDNNLYGVGKFIGLVDFDPSAGVENHTGSLGGEGGYGSGFVQKMDKNGNLLWVEIMHPGLGADAFANVNSISADEFENIYVSGLYADSVYINTSPVSEFESAGLHDSFIIKFGAACDIDNSISLSGITLTVAETGATYQWLDCDDADTEIPGATDQSYTAVANGNYSCRITTPDCEEISDCMAISTVGIEDDLTIDFAVYPNPTNGILNINTSGAIHSQLYTTNGELVYSSDSKQLDLSNLAAGLYVLKTSTSKGAIVNKIQVK